MLQKLAPQQIQLMKLLQVPTANLEQRIKEELEENPALEEGDFDEDTDDSTEDDTYGEEGSYEERGDEDREGDEVSPDFEKEKDNPLEFSDYLNEYIEDDEASYKTRGDAYSADEEQRSMPVAIESTFHDYLEQQVGMMDLGGPTQEAIARQIIGSIDDDGYLRREIDSIMDDLLFSQNIIATEADIRAILKKIQRFDPPGIGARDLQECLLLQLEWLLEQENLKAEDRPPLQLAVRILSQCFDEFTKKHFDKLQRVLNVSEDELKEAIDEILHMTPHPAGAFVGSSSASNQNVCRTISSPTPTESWN